MEEFRAALIDAGFEEDDELRASLDAKADERPNFRDKPGQPYELLGAYRNGDISVVVEQNTAPRLGVGVVETFPVVAVVQGPLGRVALNPETEDDLPALIERTIQALTDPDYQKETL